ncbi:MAG: oligosaccharide flippase family protein [Phycisphaerales bacterium]|nr:oligosaccharide flippase family protein [Phycisphaerales bacterium]
MTPISAHPVVSSHSLWLGRWVSRGAWSLVDQALFSLANLLILLLLARWLSPADFGRFTIAFTVFLLLATVHTAAVVEPLLIYGPRRFSARLPAYLGAVLVLQTPVAVAISGLMAAAAGVCLLVGAHPIATPLLAMAAAGPLILLLWLARRPWYVQQQPQRSAAGGAVYLAIVVAALAMLSASGKLTTTTAICTMALASVLASGVLLVGLRLVWPPRVRAPILRRAARAHWEYGRWAVGSAFLGLLPTQLCYLVLPEFHGIESSAGLRAISNLVLPLIQMNIAFAAVLLPAMSRHRGTPQALRVTLAGLAALVILPLVGWGALVALGKPLLQLCYGPLYSNLAGVVWIVAATPVVLGLSMLINMMLQTRGRQDAVFYATLASAIVAATAGVALVWLDEVRGAAVGVNLSLFVAVVVGGAFLISGRTGRTEPPMREPI